MLANPALADDHALRSLEQWGGVVVPELAFYFSLWDNLNDLTQQPAFGISHASLPGSSLEHLLLEQRAALRLFGLDVGRPLAGSCSSERYMLYSPTCVATGSITGASQLQIDSLSTSRRIHVELDADAFARPARIEVGIASGSKSPIPTSRTGNASSGERRREPVLPVVPTATVLRSWFLRWSRSIHSDLARPGEDGKGAAPSLGAR